MQGRRRRVPPPLPPALPHAEQRKIQIVLAKIDPVEGREALSRCEGACEQRAPTTGGTWYVSRQWRTKRWLRAHTICGAAVTRGNRETTEQSMRHVTDQHAYEQSAGGNDEDGEEGRGGPPRVRQRLRCAVQDKACRGGRRAGKEVSG